MIYVDWRIEWNRNVVNYYFLFRRNYLFHLFIWEPSYFVVYRRHHYLFWKSPFLPRKAMVRRLPIWSPSTYPLIPLIHDAKKHFHVIIHTLSPVCSGSVVVTAYAARELIYYKASITAQGLPEPSSLRGCTFGTWAAEHKGYNWGVQIDWWLQPSAVFGHTFSGIIWHMPQK